MNVSNTYTITGTSYYNRDVLLSGNGKTLINIKIMLLKAMDAYASDGNVGMVLNAGHVINAISKALDNPLYNVYVDDDTTEVLSIINDLSDEISDSV